MSDIIVVRGGNGNRTLYSAFSTTDTLTAATINTTETAFATSYTFPANYFTQGKLVRISMAIEGIATAAVPTSTIRMRLQKAGPTNVNLYTTTALANTVGAPGYGAIFYLQGTTTPGAAVAIEVGGALINGLGLGGRNTLTSPFTFDATAAQTLQFTLQFSTNAAGNSTTLRQFFVEELG